MDEWNRTKPDPILFMTNDGKLHCGRKEIVGGDSPYAKTDPKIIAEKFISQYYPLSSKEVAILKPFFKSVQGKVLESLPLSREIDECMKRWKKIADNGNQPMLYLEYKPGLKYELGSLRCCSTHRFGEVRRSTVAIEDQFLIAKYLVGKKISLEDKKLLKPFREYLINNKDAIIKQIDSNREANKWPIEGKVYKKGREQFMKAVMWGLSSAETV